MKIPKKGMLAKVYWRDMTLHTSYQEERDWGDMVLKCTVGLLMPTKDRRVVRILSEWEIEHSSTNDGTDLVLVKAAIEKIIQLKEEECSTKKNPKKK